MLRMVGKPKYLICETGYLLMEFTGFSDSQRSKCDVEHETSEKGWISCNVQVELRSQRYHINWDCLNYSLIKGYVIKPLSPRLLQLHIQGVFTALVVKPCFILKGPLEYVLENHFDGHRWHQIDQDWYLKDKNIHLGLIVSTPISTLCAS